MRSSKLGIALTFVVLACGCGRNGEAVPPREGTLNAPSPGGSALPVANGGTTTSAANAMSATSATNVAPAYGAHHPPLHLRAEGPSVVSAGSDIEVHLVIDRNARDVPLDFTVELPAGVHLVRGQLSEHIADDTATIDRTLVVHVDTMPTGDIRVIADTHSTAFGARAMASYRFGRPEPRFSDPPRAASSTIVGTKNLGRPIELPASPASP